ncbi:hypothetical protein AB0M02_14965 [Actinoplanes sp. NPDC051861]|uniref:hypothetical protein n=1 Tax=Actinoplanes sp. NPDC051861 TaxID=3155170 RepID=UPI00342FC1B6
MPIARSTLGVASMVAAFAVPVAPASPLLASPSSAQASGRCSAGGFSARSQADLAKISVLEPGPIAPDQPALADVRLAVASGEAGDRKSVAAGRYAGARILGMPMTDDAAVHRAPGRRPGPVTTDLASLDTGGLLTVKAGRATASAFPCAGLGPLTRSASMLGGISILSLLKVGPTGSAQSATDLVRVRGGRVGVRSGAGVALGDLSLLPGTPHEVSIKVVTQPALEVTAAPDPAYSKVDYRPAVLEVTTGGKKVSMLDDAGAELSLSVLGRTHANRPAAIAVRLSLGRVRQRIEGRRVRAEAATLRVEASVGRVRLLDVALGNLYAEACAPDRGRAGSPPVPSPAPVSSPPALSPPVAGSPGVVLPAVPSPPAAVLPAASSPAPSLPSPASPSPSPAGGALALTGSNVAAAGLGGAGLIIAGLVAMVVGRRRRSR